MPDSPLLPPRSDADPLRDRVLVRVRQAELAADRRGSSRVLQRRHRQAHTAASDGLTPEQRREARALRRVFLDLRDSYREFRRRTGAPVSAEVRDAACRFRQEPDLASLVSVAASVDRLEPLGW